MHWQMTSTNNSNQLDYKLETFRMTVTNLTCDMYRPAMHMHNLFPEDIYAGCTVMPRALLYLSQLPHPAAVFWWSLTAANGEKVPYATLWRRSLLLCRAVFLRTRGRYYDNGRTRTLRTKHWMREYRDKMMWWMNEPLVTRQCIRYTCIILISTKNFVLLSECNSNSLHFCPALYTHN